MAMQLMSLLKTSIMVRCRGCNGQSSFHKMAGEPLIKAVGANVIITLFSRF